ncbi:hypothetical protein D3C72_2428550 [compost metagenome]
MLDELIASGTVLWSVGERLASKVLVKKTVTHEARDRCLAGLEGEIAIFAIAVEMRMVVFGHRFLIQKGEVEGICA